VYWVEGGKLYLRKAGTQTVQVDEAKGGGGVFQAATPNGALAFFSKENHLFRYDVATETIADLTPAGGVQGMLGASEDGSHVYYLGAGGLFLNRNGADTKVAATADLTNVPPSLGTARVSADGIHLAFVSSAELTDYDNTDHSSKKPDSEVYLYDANGGGSLVCVSCNPTGGRPSGPSSIPGAVANGKAEGATHTYKPRALSANGRRLFFDSVDALVVGDKNELSDVYEWEAEGVGSCQKPGGCLQLISGGEGKDNARFIDASADGSDVLFLTGYSLVPSDPGSVDLYDARAGGGFPVPPTPIPCTGDACQGLPPPPDDPAPGTLVPAAGNSAPHFRKPGRKKPKHRKHRRQGRRHR
jgi:hypothetical protein